MEVPQTHTESGLDTRQRILQSAAVLFARRGFHGTSTRDIANEVGIRQPSLFHHFTSKHAMLAELLDRDLGQALERIRRYRATAGCTAARLHAYLVEDVAALSEAVFDARGLYNDEVLGEDHLTEQRNQRKQLHYETRDLVSEGIASGEFREIDPVFAQQVITGMLLDTIWVAGTRLSDDLSNRPTEVADYVLLGLLRKPDSLAMVRAEAAALAVAG